ncbi:hypothetical protein TNCV_2948931 [Trichonephila clavipes]|nr:hypothetical protein TNCV_2948931 [Trichonephila clavipes]
MELKRKLIETSTHQKLGQYETAGIFRRRNVRASLGGTQMDDISHRHSDLLHHYAFRELDIVKYEWEELFMNSFPSERKFCESRSQDDNEIVTCRASVS